MRAAKIIWRIIHTIAYEDMIDHHSDTHNLSNCEIKAWKKIPAWTVFEAMISAIPVQCSTNWALMSQLGAGDIASS